MSGLSSMSSAQPANSISTLRLALSGDVTSLDPHFLNAAPNNTVARHLFESLVQVDADGRLQPALAESWRAVDPTTWEFRLRAGVRFHNGQELTAEDVIFSLDRPAVLVKSPGPFTAFTRPVVAKEIVDARTIRLRTATPYGPLPLDLSNVFIVSRKVAESAGTDDFNTGRAVIGTGPWRFTSWRRGDAIELARHDAYWGAKPAFDRVTLRIITSDPTRMAALLSGDIDALETVPTADIAKLRANPKFVVEQRASWRTLFFHPDHARDKSPFVFDKSGRPLEKNPLRDVRVRQAISMAIDRRALVEKTMEGLATTATNIVAPGILGHNETLKPDAYDPAAARKLLAEAGWPDGFGLTLHGPNDRYINDEQVVQTVAQMLARIGIAVKVETQPVAVYFARARRHEFSFALLGWGSNAGDFALRTLVGTVNPDTGWGTWNWGRYSNPQVDALVSASLASVDAKKRDAQSREAMALAMRDYAVIPLHHQFATWAMRRGVRYTARLDEFTYAHQFRLE
ncbi:MAG: ABC transporter substrate-binding protein [Proteobacteria bacterium]|nr:ABC transporter substrate-binding protein [Burkholderiales bacterium]